MHRASRPILIALPFICVLQVGPVPPASPPAPHSESPPSTIEPTLPLVIDLRAVAVATSPDAPPRADLEVEMEAGPDVSDVTIALVLPGDLRALEDSFPSGAPFSVPAGGGITFEAHLVAERPGLFPVQVEVGFRDAAGREYRTRQGIDLKLGQPAPGPRANAGAWEVMAVPLQDLNR